MVPKLFIILNCQRRDYNKNFIVCHSLSDNKYNYKSGHMYEILKSDACKHLSDNQINDFIKENMALMDILLGE